MKRVLSLVFSMGLAVTSAGCGCGYGEDQNCGAIGGELIMPRALLDLNVSKIQVIALDNGSGRNVGRLLSTCQKSNLGSEFQKDDMVEIHDGGDKKDALVVDVTRAELESGVELQIELETGTNYLFIFEILGTDESGALKLLANGSSVYEKVSKGSDNKSFSVSLEAKETAPDCDPLFN